MTLCRTCIKYTPEYQGYSTEFVNYCRLKRIALQYDQRACRNYTRASDEEMDIRKKVWRLWAVLQRSVQI